MIKVAGSFVPAIPGIEPEKVASGYKRRFLMHSTPECIH
jgi:hypothetical protein